MWFQSPLKYFLSLGLRIYKGKVSFLPVAEYKPSTGSEPKVLHKVRRFSLRSNASGGSMSPVLQRYTRHGDILSKERSVSCNDGDWLRKTVESESRGKNHYRSHVNGSISEIESDINNGDASSDSAFDNDSGHPKSNGGSGSFDQSNHNWYSSIGSSEPLSNQTESGDKGKTSPKDCNGAGDDSFTVLDESKEVDVLEETYVSRKADNSPVPTPLLPPLDEPVPESWSTVQGDFVVICAAYQSHLGSDVLVAPDARLNDGCIHLMMIREGISQFNLLSLIKAIETGAHIHSPYVEIVKVLAFRLEPTTTHGNIMIDGERFDPQPVQAQILPGLACAMAIK